MSSKTKDARQRAKKRRLGFKPQQIGRKYSLCPDCKCTMSRKTASTSICKRCGLERGPGFIKRLVKKHA